MENKNKDLVVIEPDTKHWEVMDDIVEEKPERIIVTGGYHEQITLDILLHTLMNLKGQDSYSIPMFQPVFPNFSGRNIGKSCLSTIPKQIFDMYSFMGRKRSEDYKKKKKVNHSKTMGRKKKRGY